MQAAADPLIAQESPMKPLQMTVEIPEEEANDEVGQELASLSICPPTTQYVASYSYVTPNEHIHETTRTRSTMQRKFVEQTTEFLKKRMARQFGEPACSVVPEAPCAYPELGSDEDDDDIGMWKPDPLTEPSSQSSPSQGDLAETTNSDWKETWWKDTEFMANINTFFGDKLDSWERERLATRSKRYREKKLCSSTAAMLQRCEEISKCEARLKRLKMIQNSRVTVYYAPPPPLHGAAAAPLKPLPGVLLVDTIDVHGGLRFLRGGFGTHVSAPQPRSGHVAISCPSRRSIVVIGGYGVSGTYYGDVWEYFVEYDVWVERQCTAPNPDDAMPACFGHSGCLFADRYVFLYGGLDKEEKSMSACFQLDLDTGLWSRIAGLALLPNWGSTAVTARVRNVERDDCLRAAEREAAVNEGEKKKQSVKLGSGKQLVAQPASPTEARDGKEEVIIIFGGTDDNQSNNYTVMIRVRTGEIIFNSSKRRNLSLLKERRRHSAAVYRDGFMLIFGGRQNVLSFLNDMWVFNAETRFWIPVREEVSASDMQAFFNHPYDASIGERILIRLVQYVAIKMDIRCGQMEDERQKIHRSCAMARVNAKTLARISGEAPLVWPYTLEEIDTSLVLTPLPDDILIETYVDFYFHKDDNARNSTASPRTGVTSACVGDEFFVFGGFAIHSDNSSHSFKDLHVYNIAQHRWYECDVREPTAKAMHLRGLEISMGKYFPGEMERATHSNGVSTTHSTATDTTMSTSATSGSDELDAPSSSSVVNKKPLRDAFLNSMRSRTQMEMAAMYVEVAKERAELYADSDARLKRNSNGGWQPSEMAVHLSRLQNRQAHTSSVHVPSGRHDYPPVPPNGFGMDMKTLLPRTMASLCPDPINPRSRLLLFGGRRDDDPFADLVDIRIHQRPSTLSPQYCLFNSQFEYASQHIKNQLFSCHSVAPRIIEEFPGAMLLYLKTELLTPTENRLALRQMGPTAAMWNWAEFQRLDLLIQGAAWHTRRLLTGSLPVVEEVARLDGYHVVRAEATAIASSAFQLLRKLKKVTPRGIFEQIVSPASYVHMTCVKNPGLTFNPEIHGDSESRMRRRQAYSFRSHTRFLQWQRWKEYGSEHSEPTASEHSEPADVEEEAPECDEEEERRIAENYLAAIRNNPYYMGGLNHPATNPDFNAMPREPAHFVFVRRARLADERKPEEGDDMIVEFIQEDFTPDDFAEICDIPWEVADVGHMSEEQFHYMEDIRFLPDLIARLLGRHCTMHETFANYIFKWMMKPRDVLSI